MSVHAHLELTNLSEHQPHVPWLWIFTRFLSSLHHPRVEITPHFRKLFKRNSSWITLDSFQHLL